MNINDTINQMDLSQLNVLLNKSVQVKFSGYDLYQPQITWKKHGYEGFINFTELTQHIFKTHDRDLASLDRTMPPLADKRIARIQQINCTIAAMDTTKEIENKVITMWLKRSSLGAIAAIMRPSLDALYLMGQFATNVYRIYRQQPQPAIKISNNNELPRICIFFRSSLICEKGDIEHKIAMVQRGKAEANQHRSFYMQPSSKPKINPYKVMGLPPKATNKEVKKKYKRIALIIHPDKNLSDPKATQKFQKLQDAFDILKDPIKRLEYDKENGINFAL